jgi:hypothetical protein
MAFVFLPKEIRGVKEEVGNIEKNLERTVEIETQNNIYSMLVTTACNRVSLACKYNKTKLNIVLNSDAINNKLPPLCGCNYYDQLRVNSIV